MPKRKIYQILVNGSLYGYPVVGYKAALLKRRAYLSDFCRFPYLRNYLLIVDTPAVSQCQSCHRYCSARLREVRS